MCLYPSISIYSHLYPSYIHLYLSISIYISLYHCINISLYIYILYVSVYLYIYLSLSLSIYLVVEMFLTDWDTCMQIYDGKPEVNIQLAIPTIQLL